MSPDASLVLLLVGLAAAVAGEIHVYRHRQAKGQSNGHDAKRRPPGS